MKTKIKKTAAAFLFALLCLTVFPASVSAADSAERTASVAIPVSVNLSGEVPSPAETYTVTMQAAEEGTPRPSENTLTITGVGTAAFPAVTYTQPGIYCYTVTQQAGSHARGHYDNTVYYVRISVTNGENGGLEAVAAVHTDAQMISVKQELTFTNTYDPVPQPSTQTPADTTKTDSSDSDTSSGNQSDSNISPDNKANSDARSDNQSDPGTDTGKTDSGTRSAKTGDSNNPMLWMGMLIIAGSGLAAVAGDYCRKKRRKQNG